MSVHVSKGAPCQPIWLPNAARLCKTARRNAINLRKLSGRGRFRDGGPCNAMAFSPETHPNLKLDSVAEANCKPALHLH
jgi:hypothetical protein